MKKALISMVIIIILVMNVIPIGAVSLQNDYPESEHNYSNNFYNHWTYSHKEKTDCLFVTFSQDTYFGPGSKDMFDELKYDFNCDYLIISSGEESFEEIYFSDELAGKTIFIPGSKFTITLSTDSSGDYYGFKITDISTQGDIGNYASVTYKIDENNQEKHFYKLTDEGAFPISSDLKNHIFNDKAIIGWKDGNGHEYIYKNSRNVDNFPYYYYSPEYTNAFELKPGDEIVLSPICTPVSITPDETFRICNDYSTFRNGYKMTDAHAKQLRKCYLSATWKNQFGILGVPLGLLLPGIYQKVSWAGSCCGFPIATLMQHYGMIDLRSEQEVSSVSDIKPTENITSAINFYNAVTPAAIVCSNKAPEPGTDEYKSQIKNLFETVSGGKPAVCFINCGYIDGVSYKNVFSIMTGVLSKGIRYMITAFARTHCILLTGAYTDGDGNRIFIGYDENKASYCYGKPQIYKVSGDFENVMKTEVYGNSSLGSIAWFSDVSFLESFKADGETDSSAWYSYYCENKDTL